MKRILISCLLLFSLVMTVSAQSTQQVLVREYQQQRQKTPLEGVSLTVQNAGSTMSDAQGSLTLQFRSLKAGDQVQVRRVDLSGYEIFNKDAVDQWTISPQQAFTLVLCKSERFKALRDQYMRVSSASYERQYKQEQARIEALKRENKLKEEEYQEQMQLLEDNYYQQLDNLENYVDRFARIDLSKIGEQEQHIVELVQEGNIDEAVRLYESGDYLNKYKAQVEDIREIDRAQARLAQIEAEKLEARNKLFDAIDRQMQVYMLAGGRENFEKIDLLLKGVADADTTNLDALIKYVAHANEQENYEESEKYLGMYLRQSEGKEHLLWRAYFSLGEQNVALFQLDKAEEYLKKSVQLSQNIRQSMLSLSTLHSLYWFTESFEMTDAVCAQMRKLFDEVAVQDAESQMWMEAARLDAERAHIAFVRGEDASAAEAQIASAYKLAKQNMNNNGIESLQQYAAVLSVIIMAYESVGRLDMEDMYLKEQLQAYETMYNHNPRAYTKTLFEGYNNMADNLITLNHPEEAKPFLDKALLMIPEIENSFGSTTHTILMVFYDTMANYYVLQGDETKVQEYAARCMAAYNQMPAEMQEVYLEVKEHWTK